MTDSNTTSAFRFAYFTDKYEKTCAFYLEQLELERELSWDRSEHNKGSTFKAGVGLIEVLHKPKDEALFNPGLTTEHHKEPSSLYRFRPLKNFTTNARARKSP